MLTIDLPTARRFILGTQGLWPGRPAFVDWGGWLAARPMGEPPLSPLARPRSARARGIRVRPDTMGELWVV